jgi:hypothetical protein
MAWVRIWDSARQAASTVSTAPSACLLLDAILRNGLLGANLTASFIQDSLFPAGKNGPSGLTQEAMILFINIMQSQQVDKDEAFQSLARKILSWLDLNWYLRTLNPSRPCFRPFNPADYSSQLPFSTGHTMLPSPRIANQNSLSHC